MIVMMVEFIFFFSICFIKGGFISSNWLNKPEPSFDSSVINSNISLRKYLPWIQRSGGWFYFQSVLQVLDKIAKKHGVSLSNVAGKISAMLSLKDEKLLFK